MPPETLSLLKLADQRITDLCRMVCILSKNPHKVRPEDWAEEIRDAIKANT